MQVGTDSANNDKKQEAVNIAQDLRKNGTNAYRLPKETNAGYDEKQNDKNEQHESCRQAKRKRKHDDEWPQLKQSIPAQEQDLDEELKIRTSENEDKFNDKLNDDVEKQQQQNQHATRGQHSTVHRKECNITEAANRRIKNQTQEMLVAIIRERVFAWLPLKRDHCWSTFLKMSR